MVTIIKKNQIKKIPTKTSGVYFFFNKNKKLVYIGTALNIRNRIQQHKRKYYWKYVKYIAYAKSKKRYDLETCLIKKFNPKWNVTPLPREKQGVTPHICDYCNEEINVGNKIESHCWCLVQKKRIEYLIECIKTRAGKQKETGLGDMDI